MSLPPFLISELTPGNTDFVANFPTAERAYREVVETWLSSISDNYGHTQVGYGTTAERDADVNFTQASIIFNTTLGALQVCTTAPSTWATVSFPTGTRCVFQQTTAPVGWTKESSATYNDAALRFTTGTAASGGTAAFTTTFASRTISQANLPNVTLTTTISDPGHAHTYFPPQAISAGGASGSGVTVVGALNVTGTSTTGITASTALGGSGTAMDFAVKYADCIIAVKD